MTMDGNKNQRRMPSMSFKLYFFCIHVIKKRLLLVFFNYSSAHGVFFGQNEQQNKNAVVEQKRLYKFSHQGHQIKLLLHSRYMRCGGKHIRPFSIV